MPSCLAKSTNNIIFNNNKKASEEDEETQYYALKTVLANKKPNKEQLERLGVGNTVEDRRRSSTKIAPTVTDPILHDEIKHATQQLTAQMTIVEQRLKRLQARKVALWGRTRKRENRPWNYCVVTEMDVSRLFKKCICKRRCPIKKWRNTEEMAGRMRQRA
jgi:hypothetical protein